MSRVVVVSNRLPMSVHKNLDGELILDTVIDSLPCNLSPCTNYVWVGWTGQYVEESEQNLVADKLRNYSMEPVFLPENIISSYYGGFCHRTLWPHFHYFVQHTVYEDSLWESYKTANSLFANAVAKCLRPGDIVWIHDYHLMLLPKLLRTRFPSLSIGYFLHIPFPSNEIFRTLPWRVELLQGVLGADLVGFHTFSYERHFLSSVFHILRVEHNFGKLQIRNRTIKVDVYPMGIDYDKFAVPKINSESAEVKSIRNAGQTARLILSVDRLDYSKGITQRIQAYERFLRDHPDYKGKVTLVLIVVPSRVPVQALFHLKSEIELLVGRINGELSTFAWSPIRYFYRAFNFDSLVAMYQSCDIALITPLRDGMNLVAKEFVAAKEMSKRGVLILSEMAGSAEELESGALLVNPCDITGVAQTLLKAVEMPYAEQQDRLKEMQSRLKSYTVLDWANSFLEELRGSDNNDPVPHTLSQMVCKTLLTEFRSAKTRLLLLSVAGTLLEYQKDPRKLQPDPELLNCLASLKKQEGTCVVLFGGVHKKYLNEWFGKVASEMVAENGAMVCGKPTNGMWKPLHGGVSSEWKPKLIPLMNKLVQRTAGTYIESKDYSLTWHYSSSEHEMQRSHLHEIWSELNYWGQNLHLYVTETDRAVEVRNAGVSRGKAAELWLDMKPWDMILCMGEGIQQEVLESLPSSAHTIRVGTCDSKFKFRMRSINEARALLSMMAQDPEEDVPENDVDFGSLVSVFPCSPPSSRDTMFEDMPIFT